VPSGYAIPQPFITVRTVHFRSDRGATSVEYAIFVALVAAVIFVSVTALGAATLHLFEPVGLFFQAHH
jgi:Flp pilus assembly pilin Flp